MRPYTGRKLNKYTNYHPTSAIMMQDIQNPNRKLDLNRSLDNDAVFTEYLMYGEGATINIIFFFIPVSNMCRFELSFRIGHNLYITGLWWDKTTTYY